MTRKDDLGRTASHVNAQAVAALVLLLLAGGGFLTRLRSRQPPALGVAAVILDVSPSMDRLRECEDVGRIAEEVDSRPGTIVLTLWTTSDGRIMQGLGDGVIKEILTPNRSYTNADDKLMMSIEFGMSTKFIDDLSRNIARGRRQSLETGGWPGAPKLGYIRDRNLNLLVPDPERFELVHELWRLKLQDLPTLEILRHSRTRLGLRTRARGRHGGGFLSASRLYVLFHDPFYAGICRFKGETYRGRHQPMITWSEFETVQTALAKGPTNTPKNFRHAFTYRGLITCGRCGAMATAEYTKNRHGKRYTYYHCCRKNRRYRYCPERSIEESAVERQLDAFLASLQLPSPVLDSITAILPELEAGLRTPAQHAGRQCEATIEEQQRKLLRLRQLLTDDVITPDDYRVDREAALAAQRTAEDQLRRLHDPASLIEPFRQALPLVNQAVFLFRRGDADEKRSIIRTVSSNLVLRDKSLLVQAKNPFAFFVDVGRFPAKYRQGESDPYCMVENHAS